MLRRCGADDIVDVVVELLLPTGAMVVTAVALVDRGEFGGEAFKRERIP
ncbi:MAG: hypothetical protein M3179_02830 [Actinomycetota bacterium]|nr:hypothetical protein [Actinomycetota bacterium]